MAACTVDPCFCLSGRPHTSLTEAVATSYRAAESDMLSDATDTALDLTAENPENDARSQHTHEKITA